MTINKSENETELIFSLDGDMDTPAASLLEAELGNLYGVGLLIMDFTKLQSITTAGLRVLLDAQITMNQWGQVMIIRNANDGIKRMMEITGCAEILTIE